MHSSAANGHFTCFSPALAHSAASCMALTFVPWPTFVLDLNRVSKVQTDFGKPIVRFVVTIVRFVVTIVRFVVTKLTIITDEAPRPSQTMKLRPSSNEAHDRH